MSVVKVSDWRLIATRHVSLISGKPEVHSIMSQWFKTFKNVTLPDFKFYLGIVQVFSSPEPKAQWWAYRIGRPLSSGCMCVCTCVNIFNISETTGPIEAKFHMELPWDGGTKVVQTVLVTWPRWLPCPYMVKSLKNLLLRNQKTDDLETWHAASSVPVLPSLFKWWPWVDLDLFYSKVKFGPMCFCMGKR